MRTLTLCVMLLVSCGEKDKESPVQENQTTVFPSPQGEPYQKIVNLSQHWKTVSNYHDEGFRGQKKKVAIFDNGFAGLEQAKGLTLPPQLKIQPYPKNKPKDTEHGTRMAEIVLSTAMGNDQSTDPYGAPEVLLFNTNGFTNLKAAISKAIEMKVDVILYSQVWQYGGNFDGKGFINAEVNRATDAGIIWINAAGNFAQASYETTVKLNTNGDVTLPDFENSLVFNVEIPKTEAKIVASWNDYGDSENDKSQFDFDLAVLKMNGDFLASSQLAQAEDRKSYSDGPSAFPRELVTLPLDQGSYRIKLKARSGHRIPDDMKIRISIDGPGIQMPKTQPENSLMIPADNPSVITIGANDFAGSSFSTASSGARKPEWLIDSVIKLEDGLEIRSTSTAAAIACGSLLPILSKHSGLTRSNALWQLSQDGFKVQTSAPQKPIANPQDLSYPRGRSNSEILNEGRHNQINSRGYGNRVGSISNEHDRSGPAFN